MSNLLLLLQTLVLCAVVQIQGNTTQSKCDPKVDPKSYSISVMDDFLADLSPIEHNVLSNLTKVWTVETNGSDTFYNDVSPNHIDLEANLYENANKSDLVMAHCYKGTLYMDIAAGVSKESFIVAKSMPVYNYNTTPYFAKQAADTSNTMYPKLLVVVEYNIFKEWNESVKGTVDYLTLFWNKVNHRFSQFVDPKLLFHVTGIVIAKDNTSLRYISDAFDKNTNNISIVNMTKKAPEYFSNLFGEKIHFQNYNAIITMININSSDVDSSVNNLNGICSPGYRNAASFVDDGFHNGIQEAVDVMAKLLDLHNENNDCVFPEGVTPKPVTSNETIDKDGTVWSECSKQRLKSLQKSPIGDCWKNYYRQ